MHEMIQAMGLRAFLRREAANLGVALLLAELFYKFHSFLLEGVAFLATWYVLSWLANRVLFSKRTQ